MKDNYDVIVVGGGIAGIAAALQAGRENKKVALIEKQCFLGGLATSGIVTIYLPICDGMGHQVSYGIAEELLLLSMKMGYQSRYPKPWLENGTIEEKKKTRYKVQYNPVYFAILAEKLLLENNVDILYDSLVVKVNKEGNRLESIEVENIEGRKKIKGKAFVDCSGDARLFYLLNDEVLTYKEGNILASWYYCVENGKAKLNMLGYAESPLIDKKQNTDIDKKYYGEKYESENEFVIDSHTSMLNDIQRKRMQDETFEAVKMPAMPQFRMIRCLQGKTILKDVNRCYYKDSIGIIADWRRNDYIYEVPLSSLCSRNYENVFAAGRCMSTDEEMWDITRVIPCAAVTGQGAGMAASYYCDNGYLDIDSIQNKLQKAGVVLHIKELDLK